MIRNLLGIAPRGRFNLRGLIMQGVARNFFILGIVMAIAGMMLGLRMAMTNNHVQMPVHAHIMVAGWLMSAVFGFFYHLFPVARQNKLAHSSFLDPRGQHRRACRFALFRSGGKSGG